MIHLDDDFLVKHPWLSLLLLLVFSAALFGLCVWAVRSS